MFGSGFDLAFLTLPTLFNQWGAFGPFACAMWFGLLFFAGITSSLAMGQPVVAFLQDEFKALLKRLSKGEPPPPRHELTARDIDGDDFPAVMEFTAAQYEGEACQQVIFRRQAVEQDPELARQVEELKQRDQATGTGPDDNSLEVFLLHGVTVTAVIGHMDRARNARR